jgi:cytochrome b561
MILTERQVRPAAASQPTWRTERRYGAVSIGLHWTIAALIVVQIGLGWWMGEGLPDHSPAQARVELIHISVGLTILLLVLVRIGVRLSHPAPAPPARAPLWERALARFTHLVFYVLMLALPLSGWAMVSAGSHPILFWGLPWPHMPGLGVLADPAHKPLRRSLHLAHTTILIWIVLANMALHVAGALKHQFDGRPVLWRMAPFVRPRPVASPRP